MACGILYSLKVTSVHCMPGLQEVEESKATSMSAEELMDLLKADAGSNDVPQSGVADDKARSLASGASVLLLLIGGECDALKRTLCCHPVFTAEVDFITSWYLCAHARRCAGAGAALG